MCCSRSNYLGSHSFKICADKQVPNHDHHPNLVHLVNIGIN